MTEVRTKNIPNSLGAIGLVAGLAVSQLALNLSADRTERVDRAVPHVDYALMPSTYGQYAYMFIGERNALMAEAEAKLQSFYAELLTKQERLGREFEDVLFANLRTLYSR